MSAPFPDAMPTQSRGQADPHAAVFQPTQVIAIPQRDAHIPSWYVQHQNPEKITVTQDGLPVLSPPGAANRRSFTVAEVAPELRWAIQQNGEVLPQHIFDNQMQQVYEEYSTKVLGDAFVGNVGREKRRNVCAYVSRCVSQDDPRKLRPIGYDPMANRGRKPTVLWSADGETMIEGDQRLAVLIASYRDPVLKNKLKPWELEEVEKVLSETAALSLDAIRARGELAEAKAEPQKTEAPKKIAPVRACGARVWPMHFPKHKAKCAACSAGGAA